MKSMKEASLTRKALVGLGGLPLVPGLFRALAHWKLVLVQAVGQTGVLQKVHEGLCATSALPIPQL